MHDRSFVDNYRTPHTDKIHVVERFKMIEDGKTLQVTFNVTDPGAFTMPWTGVQRFRRVEDRPMIENLCEVSNDRFFENEITLFPQDDSPDF
jgi:hypothetical protein